MNIFKIGDKVEIVNTGNHYPTYLDMAIELKATKWIRNTPIRCGLCGTIVNKHIRVLSDEKNIYLVDLGNIEILISAGGIRLLREWDEEEN